MLGRTYDVVEYSKSNCTTCKAYKKSIVNSEIQKFKVAGDESAWYHPACHSRKFGKDLDPTVRLFRLQGTPEEGSRSIFPGLYPGAIPPVNQDATATEGDIVGGASAPDPSEVANAVPSGSDTVPQRDDSPGEDDMNSAKLGASLGGKGDPTAPAMEEPQRQTLKRTHDDLDTYGTESHNSLGEDTRDSDQKRAMLGSQDVLP
ncbi:hypothetical protein M427DRAFT_44369 [Gonapodya prolifera JEL478]|uniref:PARP-type domain-containing protein n=1 Tax=Gonapodya prolifera (strain JEL478) TaxID=1344416 RepID=A0A139AFB8_GONPJ|nr:hypothetical protein M427DRAFT_44369 [Gonapodya prolifera JEL478]|eukprot:KXS15511.1 hypothetical protein M427DRAFT_44369 [Gonapodya prolifera JEL478]